MRVGRGCAARKCCKRKHHANKEGLNLLGASLRFSGNLEYATAQKDGSRAARKGGSQGKRLLEADSRFQQQIGEVALMPRMRCFFFVSASD
jgi:hypothetical protein